MGNLTAKRRDSKLTRKCALIWAVRAATKRWCRVRSPTMASWIWMVGDAEQRNEEGAEDLVDVGSINVDMLNNLVTAIFVMAILVSVAIVAVIMYVVSKCWQWAAHGKAQSMLYGKPAVKEQELTVVNEVVEEESQETV